MCNDSRIRYKSLFTCTFWIDDASFGTCCRQSTVRFGYQYLALSIDYRCDNRRFLVVRPQLSSSNPNFSKPKTRTANSDFWSWLTHRSIHQKRQILRSWGGDWQSMQDSFLSLRMNKCLKRVNDRRFWNPGVFSYAMIPRCHPNLRVFFHRHIYSLWLYVQYHTSL